MRGHGQRKHCRVVRRVRRFSSVQTVIKSAACYSWPRHPLGDIAKARPSRDTVCQQACALQLYWMHNLARTDWESKQLYGLRRCQGSKVLELSKSVICSLPVRTL